VGTVALSFLALATSALSVYISTRQASLQDKANNAAAVVSILSEFRDPKLHESFELVFHELPGHDALQGLSGLPPSLRHHTYNVCYFLTQVGSAMVLGILRESAFLALFRARAVAVWEIAGPFILRERVINPTLGPEFLTVVEALATKANMIGPELGQRILAKWIGRPSARSSRP